MEALLKVIQSIICVLDCVIPCGFFFCGQHLFSLCNWKTLKVKGNELDILGSSGRQFAKYPSPALQVDTGVERKG